MSLLLVGHFCLKVHFNLQSPDAGRTTIRIYCVICENRTRRRYRFYCQWLCCDNRTSRGYRPYTLIRKAKGCIHMRVLLSKYTSKRLSFGSYSNRLHAWIERGKGDAFLLT